MLRFPNLSVSKAVLSSKTPLRKAANFSSTSQHPPKPTPTLPSKASPIPTSTGSTSNGSAVVVNKDKSTGSGLFAVLAVLGFSSAGGAYYLRQHPEFNPAVLQDNELWQKTRKLIGIEEESNKPFEKPLNKQVQSAIVTKNSTPKKANDETMHQEHFSKKDIEQVQAKIDSTLAKKEAPAVGKKSNKVPDDNQEKVARQAEEKKKKQKKAEEKKKQQREADKKKKLEEEEKKKKLELEGKKAAEAEAIKQMKIQEEKLRLEKQQKAKNDALIASVSKEREHIDEVNAELKNLETKAATDLIKSKEKIGEAIKCEADVLEREIQDSFVSGLENLSADELRVRVVQLATEMKHHTKWETVRLLQSLKTVEEEANAKSLELLRHQADLHKELLAKELRLHEETLSRKSRDAIDILKKENAKEMEEKLAHQDKLLKEKYNQMLNSDKERLDSQFKEQLNLKVQELKQLATKESSERFKELEKLRLQLKALNAILDSTSSYEAFSHQVHKVSVAALGLSDRIEAAAPLSSELAALREAGRGDNLIEGVLASLPNALANQGAPSVAQLQERFKSVSKGARRAALVPADNKGMTGHLLASALSFLTIPPSAPIDGNDAEAICSRANFALNSGDLETAVVEMEKLQEYPAEIARDWIAAAKSRLLVEQGSKVIKAHVALLAKSCS